MPTTSRIRRPEDLGSIIRARRHALGWDQKVLAARLGVSRLWVSQIENGKPKVQLDLVLRCLNELQLPLWTSDGTLSQNFNPTAKTGSLININDIADMGLKLPLQPPVKT